MRSFLGIVSAVAVALILASSASALSWTPQGTVVAGHASALTLTSGTGTVTCTVALNMKASGAVATTTNPAGTNSPPTFSGCSNNLGISPTSVTASAPWTFTAATTTFVSWTFGNIVINIGSGTCTIAVNHSTLSNNTWSNGPHTITVSSATSFSLVRSGFCPLTASTGTWAGSFVFGSGVTVID